MSQGIEVRGETHGEKVAYLPTGARRIDALFFVLNKQPGINITVDIRRTHEGKRKLHYKASDKDYALANTLYDFVWGNGEVNLDFLNKGTDEKLTKEAQRKALHVRALRETPFYIKKYEEFAGDGEYIHSAEIEVLETVIEALHVNEQNGQVDRNAETNRYPTVNEATALPPLVAEHDGTTEEYKTHPVQLGLPEIDQQLRDRAVALAKDPAKQPTEQFPVTNEAIPHVGRQRVIPEVAEQVVDEFMEELGIDAFAESLDLPEGLEERVALLWNRNQEQVVKMKKLLVLVGSELQRLRGLKGVAEVELENAREDIENLAAVNTRLQQELVARGELDTKELEEVTDAEELVTKRKVPFAHAMVRLVTAGTILLGVIAPAFAQKTQKVDNSNGNGTNTETPKNFGLPHNANLEQLPMEPAVFEKLLTYVGFNRPAGEALAAYSAPIARKVENPDGFRYTSVTKFVNHLWPNVHLEGDFSFQAAKELDKYQENFVMLPMDEKQVRANVKNLPNGAIVVFAADENSPFNKIGDNGEAAGYVGIVSWKADGSEMLIDEIERPIDEVFRQMDTTVRVFVPKKAPEIHQAVKVYLDSMRGKTLQEGLPGLINTCKQVYPDNKVMAQLLCAQAILESGWVNLSPDDPRRELADVYNNPFGMKGVGTAGSVLVDTTEDYGAGPVPVKDNFAKFVTLQDAFDKYHSLMEWDNYAPVWQQPDFYAAADCIANALCVRFPYATAKDYSIALKGIYEQFLKEKFENVTPQVTEIHPEEVILPQNVVLGEKPQYYLGSETEYIHTIKKEFGINVDPDYDLQHVEWIWEALWSVNNTNWVQYVKGMNVVKRPTTPSEQDGCAFDSVSLSLYPYATKELFIAAFFHESGHFVDHCPVNGEPGVYMTRSDQQEYLDVEQKDGPITYYGRKNRQEDFADMIRLALYKVNAQMVNDPKFSGNIITHPLYEEDPQQNFNWEHWKYVAKLLGLKGK